jgi:cytochrome c oxidase cbb3-type subunit 3
MFCVSCHGADGKGNQMLGAPNLADGTWLYGGDLEAIKHTLRAGRNGKMPAFGEQLDEDKIRLLTAYVYSLSNQ